MALEETVPLSVRRKSCTQDQDGPEAFEIEEGLVIAHNLPAAYGRPSVRCCVRRESDVHEQDRPTPNRQSAKRCCRRRQTPSCQAWGDTSPIANSEGLDGAWISRFPLHTKGRFIFDQHGSRFKLAGANWYGASDVYHVVCGLDVQRLETICATIQTLGFTVVRLPFSNQMLRSTPEPGSIDYELNPKLRGLSSLQVFDEVVRELGKHKVAVILNNHTTFGRWSGGPEENGLWFVPNRAAPWGPQTENQWVEDWLMLASRYATCPQVIGYDLRNEVRPAPAVRGLGGVLPWLHWPVWKAGRTVPNSFELGKNERCCKVKVNFQEAVISCARRLQQRNSDGLIIVERIVWPQLPLKQYADYLLPELSGKLVLAAHCYSWTGPGRYVVRWGVPKRWLPLTRWLARSGLLQWKTYGDMALSGGCVLKDQMELEWGTLLDQDVVPVWISEFGAAANIDEEMLWLQDFVTILKHYDADWAYWPLNVGPKPGGEGDEGYGMLAKDWTPPTAGSDRRLELVQSIMAVNS